MLETTLGSLDRLSLDTYYGIELGWLEGSTDGNTYDNLEGSWLKFWLESVVGLELGTNDGNEIGLWGKSCGQ